MTKTTEIKDIAQWEENDSELAKYTIQQLLKTYDDLEEQYKLLMKQIVEQDKRIDKAIEYIEKSKLNQLDTYCKYLYINYDTGSIEHLDDLLNILRGEDNE